MKKKATASVAPTPQGHGKWLEEYRCGCTRVERFKRELPGYCAKHGESRRLVTKLLQATPSGLS